MNLRRLLAAVALADVVAAAIDTVQLPIDPMNIANAQTDNP